MYRYPIIWGHMLGTAHLPLKIVVNTQVILTKWACHVNSVSSWNGVMSWSCKLKSTIPCGRFRRILSESSSGSQHDTRLYTRYRAWVGGHFVRERECRAESVTFWRMHYMVEIGAEQRSSRRPMATRAWILKSQTATKNKEVLIRVVEVTILVGFWSMKLPIYKLALRQ